MNQTLLPTSRKYHGFLFFFLTFLCIQKSAATTFYVNDNDKKGDVYTTAIGNDTNEGTSAANPKLTIQSAYQKAQDGDTIIIDSGTYNDLTPKGEFAFSVTKKITWIIAGIPGSTFSKAPLTKKTDSVAKEFFVEKDEPIERDAYLQKIKNTTTNKPL